MSKTHDWIIMSILANKFIFFVTKKGRIIILLGLNFKRMPCSIDEIYSNWRKRISRSHKILTIANDVNQTLNG